MSLKFFTDKTVVNDYLLIKIKDYLKLKDFSQWKEIFVDPGVYDLRKSDKFSWEGEILIQDFLDSLPPNHYFSWDYPGDMNLQYQNKFLIWTYNNAINYHEHPQYIVTVQSKFRDYFNFMEWFDRYNALDIKSGILALGNICRIVYLNDYLKHTLNYAFNRCRHPRIHIYGLCLRAIPYAYELSKKYHIEFSFDSTKWTRCFHTPGRPSCNRHNRQQYFDEYKTEVEKRTIYK